MLHSMHVTAIDLNKYQELQQQYYINRNGYMQFSTEEKNNLCEKQIFTTYGEILPSGVNTLITTINPTKEDVFVDLGSGIGKIPLQFFLTTPIKSSFGIEANFQRWRHATEVLQQVKRSFPKHFANNRRLVFLHDNIMNFDFSNITLVLMNSTCFSNKLIRHIINNINKQHTIRIVMSTQQLSGLNNLPCEQIIPIDTSWHIPPNKSNCYVYSKNSLELYIQ